MKRILFTAFCFTLLFTACISTSQSPQIVSNPLLDETDSVTTPELTNDVAFTPEPTIFKVAEFGKGFVFDHTTSPNGKLIAIGSSSGVYIFSTETNELVRHVIPRTPGDVVNVAFSSDSLFLGFDIKLQEFGNEIDVVNLQTGEIAINETTGPHHISKLGFSPDGNLFYLISSATDVFGNCGSNFGIWSMKTRTKINHFFSPEELPLNEECLLFQAVTFNSDGTIVFAGYGGGIAAWDIYSAHQKFYTPAYSGEIQALFFDPFSNLVITADSGGAIRYWNGTDGENVKTIASPSKDISTISLSSDNKQLIINSFDGQTTLIEYSTGKLIGVIKNEENRDEDWESLQASLYDLGFFDLDHTELSYAEYTHHNNIAFSGDGQSLVAGCICLDSRSGKTLAVLSSCDKEDLGEGVVYSSKGNYIARGGSKLEKDKDGQYNHFGTAKLWNAKTGELLISKRITGGINTLNISKDEKMVAYGTDYVSLWSTQTNELIKNFYPSTGRVEYVGFIENDKKIIAVTVPDYLISIFDIESGSLLGLIRPPLPDYYYPYDNVYIQGNKMKAGGVLWDVDFIEKLAVIISSRDNDWSQGPVITTNERILITSDYEGFIFSDIKSGEVIYKLDLYPGFVFLPSLSPDEKQIAFFAPGGKIQLWDISRITDMLDR